MATSLQFGKYSLIERIAVGGMAEIYRAKTFGAAGFEKELVVKRILPQFSADDEFVRMFIDEARIAAKLQHNNVVQIFDFDCAALPDGESYYLAMELVDGKDLRHLLKEGIRRNLLMGFPECVHIAVETLKGLHYAHTKMEGGKPLRIVHRDVSPHNILVSYSGDVKISDFGIAKAAARASATSNGMVKGKLAYMSPEQVTGQTLDPRSDVFSLGIVLYEMLTRTRLFVAETEAETVSRVRDAVVPPIRQRNPMVPPDLEQVVMKILSHRPDDRFATAADAARALAGTSAYSANEAIGLGEYVAQLFPMNVRRGMSAPRAAAPAQAGVDRRGGVGAPAPVPPRRAQPGPVGAEGPRSAGPGAMAEQRTAIRDGGSPEGAKIAAQVAAAVGGTRMGVASTVLEEPAPASRRVIGEPSPARRDLEAARGSAAPAPARPPAGEAGGGAPLAEQRTAIFDGSSPEGAKVAAQVAAAVKRSPLAATLAEEPPPRASATPIGEQKTAIFDGSSPEGAKIAAQVAAAIAARQPAAGAGPATPLGEQKTAIFDPGSQAYAKVQAQIQAATGGRATPPPDAPPVRPALGVPLLQPMPLEARPGTVPFASAPAAGGQRTVMLESPIAPQVASVKLPPGGVRELPPVPAPKAPSTWVRWVLGPALMAVVAAITVVVLGSLDKPHAPTPPAPPPAAPKGKILVRTRPSHASITLDGKPWQRFTPTEIEGEIDRRAHVVVSIGGYRAMERDVLFGRERTEVDFDLEREDEDRPKTPPPAPAAIPTPAPEPAPADDRAGHRTAGGAKSGVLSIFVTGTPATVFVDGKRVRQTPIANLELATGKHVIELVNEEKGKHETIPMTVRPGVNPELRRNWQ